MRTVLVLVAAVVAGGLAGMTIAARGYPPYPSLEGSLATDVLGGDEGSRSAQPPVPEATGAEPPLHADTRAEALALRRRLERAIRRRPAIAAPRVVYRSDVPSDLGAPLPGVVRTDRLDVRQAYGIDSSVELHLPRDPPRGFVLVHGGHTDLEDGTRTVLEALTQRGYVVATLNMPLVGENPRPMVDLDRFGRLELTTHDLLPLLPERQDALLALFLDPVEATTERAAAMGFESVAMVGLSGGAWTTTLAAALDPRIRRSYAVAGSVPMALRSAPDNQGDFEQIGLPLYQLSDYRDLYLLGALEPGRRELLIHNDRDPCCYALDTVPPYASQVKQALATMLGGTFDLRIVDSDAHEIGAAATELIIADLAAG